MGFFYKKNLSRFFFGWLSSFQWWCMCIIKFWEPRFLFFLRPFFSFFKKKKENDAFFQRFNLLTSMLIVHVLYIQAISQALFNFLFFLHFLHLFICIIYQITLPWHYISFLYNTYILFFQAPVFLLLFFLLLLCP